MSDEAWVRTPGQSPDAQPMARTLGQTPQDAPYTDGVRDTLDSQSIGDITDGLASIVIALKALPNPATQARVLAAAGSLLGMPDIYAVVERSR